MFWQTERKGQDRADKPEYKVKLSVSFCFSNRVSVVEHYHNSLLAGARRLSGEGHEVGLCLCSGRLSEAAE